jgi:hypothetical protein
MAHAALSRKTLMSLGVTDLAITSVLLLDIRIPKIAFACGFLTVVGLCLTPYDSHRYSKCSLNSQPLL